MKSNLLFPPVFKIIGFTLAVAGLVLGYIFVYSDLVISFLDYGHGNLTDELGTTLEITGLIFIGFSRLKNESDLTGRLRLNALYWAVLADCLLVSLFWIIQYIGYTFKALVIMQHNFSTAVVEYNLFIPLFLFTGRFWYLRYRSKKGKQNKVLNLLPHTPYNQIGKITSISFIILGVAITIPLFKISNDYSDAFILFLPCLLLWLWSQEKNEIGAIKKVRLKAMQIAVYINYSLVLIATWVYYGIEYWVILNIFLVSLQVIFIIVFYYQLFRLRKKHSKKIGLTSI